MVRCYSLEYQDVIPLYDSIHCRKCRNQVACIHDYIRMVWPRGIFNRLFNVLVPENENFHLGQFGTTVVNANCIGCGELIGWKIIAVTRQSMYVREGRFCMKLNKLSLWNDVPLLHLNGLQDEENADQHGDPNEQNVDQDGDMTDGDTNEHAPNEQGGANLQNVDQDKDTNEENVGTSQYNFTNLLMHFICQNANQGGGGGNEQNHDQDGGSNEQVHNEQDVGANEKMLIKMETQLIKMQRKLIEMGMLLIEMEALPMNWVMDQLVNWNLQSHTEGGYLDFCFLPFF